MADAVLTHGISFIKSSTNVHHSQFFYWTHVWDKE